MKNKFTVSGLLGGLSFLALAQGASAQTIDLMTATANEAQRMLVKQALVGGDTDYTTTAMEQDISKQELLRQEVIGSMPEGEMITGPQLSMEEALDELSKYPDHLESLFVKAEEQGLNNAEYEKMIKTEAFMIMTGQIQFDSKEPAEFVMEGNCNEACGGLGMQADVNNTSVTTDVTMDNSGAMGGNATVTVQGHKVKKGKRSALSAVHR
tara:strand:+ start:100 stop:729 length:630 start_codon:yes stop_codon:yes gene_type:complete